MQIAPDDEIELEITSLGMSGEGVGSFQGLKIFVDGVLPTEIAKVRILDRKKNYAKASLVELLKVSKKRVAPICPLFEKCGGCQIMHLEYNAQLQAKKQRVLDAFARIAKDPIKGELVIHPSLRPLHYRNKIQLPATFHESHLCMGLYAKGSHDVIAVNRCYIHSEIGESVYMECLKLLQNSSLLPYDEQTGEGELRHLLIKTAIFNQQVLIILITTKPPTKEVIRLAKKMSEIPFVKGVIHHKNERYDNVVLDKNFSLLEGESHIHESLCGLTFRLSAASFFQINPFQAEKLYQRAIELAQLTPTTKVLDAYCGIGTLSLLMAQKAQEVIGIECVPQAIEDAKINATLNQITNVKFVCSVVEKMIGKLSDLEVAILNPPRKGCEPQVLVALEKLSVKKVVYISCDPATLARDAQLLASHGFYKDHVEAFDMFPQPMHVETIARFVRA